MKESFEGLKADVRQTYVWRDLEARRYIEEIVEQHVREADNAEIQKCHDQALTYFTRGEQSVRAVSEDLVELLRGGIFIEHLSLTGPPLDDVEGDLITLEVTTWSRPPFSLSLPCSLVKSRKSPEDPMVFLGRCIKELSARISRIFGIQRPS